MNKIKRVFRNIKNWYIKRYIKCQKCKKQIDPHYGYWKLNDVYPQIGGYYHTNCGVILDPESIRFQKELSNLVNNRNE